MPIEISEVERRVSVRDALPFLEKLVKEGIYLNIDEAVEDFKIVRERELGVSKTEVERMERHKRRVYGEESELPLGGLRLGPKYDDVKEVLYDLLPALPLEFGPLTLPLPRGIMRKIAGAGGK